MDTHSLTNWFLEEKRDLPWRTNPTPYGVLVSEVMLQQTQVSTVIPYYLRWMDRFPSIQDLAKASTDEVIKEWEGLGYYSRAKNLLKSAQFIANTGQGVIPSTYDELIAIPGIGPYTAGAILAFAFHKKQPAVDGNVMRVFSRYFAIQEEISKAKTKQKVTDLLWENLPDNAPWETQEALIELGALICKKKPLCPLCPIQNSCQAYKRGLTTLLPIKKEPQPITSINRTVFILTTRGSVLIRKVPSGEIMAGLHEFPYLEQEKTTKASLACKHFHPSASLVKKLPTITHTFTRYKCKLHPYVFEVQNKQDCKDYFWVNWEDISKLSFSSGHRKLLFSIINSIIKPWIK